MTLTVGVVAQGPPLGAAVLLGSNVARIQWHFIAWFGIRGVGSIYYLMYTVEHGLPSDLAPG